MCIWNRDSDIVIILNSRLFKNNKIIGLMRSLDGSYVNFLLLLLGISIIVIALNLISKKKKII